MKGFLEQHGCEIRRDLRLDVVGLRQGETVFVVIAELKQRFYLELVL